MPPWLRGPTLADAWASGRNNFNLIRLFAAWLVIYGHAWAITGSSGGDLLTQLTRFKFAGGIAVDVFFFISGFLIAASLERNDSRGYLASRALRILPALLVCVALSVFVLGPLLTTSADYWRNPRTWDYLWVNATLWSSRYELPGVFESLPHHAVNGSLWTLPIEARLYLALLGASLLGVLTPRRYTPLWALALAGAYAFAAWRHPLPEWLSNQMWCAGFFITGTLCWLQRARIRLGPWPLFALLAIGALARGTPWFHLPYFAIACYGTLWLAFVPTLPRIRQHDLSYGLYLYGWPAQQLAWMLPVGKTVAGNVAIATAIALACAALSWYLVERPALRLKKRFVARGPADSPIAGQD